MKGSLLRGFFQVQREMSKFTTGGGTSPFPQVGKTLGIVSINPTHAISVAAIEQELHVEIRLNFMENGIFKLGSALEKSLGLI